MIGVWSADGDRSFAELPLSTRAAESPGGSIAIVGGPDWTDRAEAALAAGARALLIAEPWSVDPARILALAGSAVSRGAPVIVERWRLALDGPSASLSFATLSAECAALDVELAETLRDTVGWVRRMAGSSLAVAEVAVASRGALALLDASGTAATILLDELAGVDAGGSVRVAGLGVARVEVTVDGATGVARLLVATAEVSESREGSLESPRRVALRRLLGVLKTGEVPTELNELAHDEAIARAIRTDQKT